MSAERTEEKDLLNDNFKYWKEEAICSNYVAGECDNEFCHLLHPKQKVPYIWQYCKLIKSDITETWVSFPPDVNIEMENQFCIPSNTYWRGIKDLVGYISYKFESEPRLSNYYIIDGQYNKIYIRRLSTKASVLAHEGDIAATEWFWYWENGDIWTKYSNYVTCNGLEKTFLIDSSKPFHFKTDKFSYVISFDDMIQKNLGPVYFTERKIKRRPLYKSKEHLLSFRPFLQCLIPSHWPRQLKIGERTIIPNKAYTKIRNDFELSFGAPVLVMNIKEVCNKELYENFKRKKQKFLMRSEQPNEMLLYHGTDVNVVDCICVQNFDWRLCGKNGTHYGQGSYFSKSALYSHRFSTLDRSNLGFMFLASVLTGQAAEGNRSMKLPPLLPKSEFVRYDSCVDNKESPIIHVIFDRDQCYPRYLIAYKEEKYVTEVDKAFAKKSFDITKGIGNHTRKELHFERNLMAPKTISQIQSYCSQNNINTPVSLNPAVSQTSASTVTKTAGIPAPVQSKQRLPDVVQNRLNVQVSVTAVAQNQQSVSATTPSRTAHSSTLLNRDTGILNSTPGSTRKTAVSQKRKRTNSLEASSSNMQQSIPSMNVYSPVKKTRRTNQTTQAQNTGSPIVTKTLNN